MTADEQLGALLPAHVTGARRDTILATITSWLSRYPYDENYNDLRSRLYSDATPQSMGAYTELFSQELLRALGLPIIPRPSGRPSRLDFVARLSGVNLGIECKYVHWTHEEGSADSAFVILNEAFSSLRDTFDHGLHGEIERVGDTTLSKREAAKAMHRLAKGEEEVRIVGGGWAITLERDRGRPRGVATGYSPGANDVERLRKRIKAASDQHRDIPFPVLLIVNAPHILNGEDNYTLKAALYGHTQVRIDSETQEVISSGLSGEGGAFYDRGHGRSTGLCGLLFLQSTPLLTEDDFVLFPKPFGNALPLPGVPTISVREDGNLVEEPGRRLSELVPVESGRPS